MKRLAYAILSLLVTGCATTAYRDIPFDYSQVLTKEYRFGTGRSIPLTFERSVNVSGSITADGKYFVYASNKERNNFDIYLRALNDITTVRLTIHPARDFSPDVSHDGKWCVFVSTRDDPEGDIFVMKLNPEKVIAQGDQEVPSSNITIIRDQLSGAIKPVRDASPCFSPDGKLIAFSSTRDGEESIFIMERDGTNIRKVTEGMQPRFSSDGTKLVFIKKTTTGNDVFTINLVTGEIAQVTSDQYLELSPCFGKTDNDIYFARIQYDTNNDGILDANDKGMLFAYDVQKKEEYPLTLLEEPSATPRWVPYADGVIVYSIVEDQYINIAMIPHTGIVPKQKTALKQYELALKYKEDFEDIDRYKRCLFATYYFFNESSDVDSQIIIAKALYELSYEQQYSFVATILADMAKRSKPAQIYVRYRTVKDKERLAYLENVVKELSAQNDEKIAPFFIEELADQYALKCKAKALDLYHEIITRYTNYTRLMYVRHKAGALSYNEFTIPEEWVTVLQSSYTYLKNAITVAIIEQTKKIPPQVRYKRALESAESNTVPIIKAIMNYVAATSLMELSKNDDAMALLKQGLEHTKKLDVAYFLINVALGQLYYAQKSDEWVVYYEAAVNNYQAQWKQDIRSIIEQLIEYFENTGQRLTAEGNFKDAAALYKRYITMNTLLHLKRRYKDIYGVNAPAAHTGYINAMLALSQSTTVNNIEKEYLERLPIARMDFDKAHIYGLGYIYVKQAQNVASYPNQMDGKSSQEFETLLGLFTKALRHIDWSLFIDDTFVDAYLLKGWIYQYVDELRVCFPSKKRLIDSYFPEYLWEKSIPLYEKALAANNENLFPQKEADIHCNIGNIYFLLKNFNLASRHFAKAVEYAKAFSTLKEEALFYYHYGYCLWQQGNYAGAYSSMQHAFTIYRAIVQKNESAIADKLYVLYKYFALFERMQGNYEKAIEWYKKALEHCAQFQCGESPSRLYIEIAECHRRLEQDNEALVYLKLAQRSLPHEKSAQYKIGWKFAGFGPVYFYDLGQDTVVTGEGKIVSHLSAVEMEILIQNMCADIYAKRGRFDAAAAQYLALAQITKKQKTSLMADAHVTALYNAAYCYAMIGDTQKALELYDNALSIAQDTNIEIGKIYQTMVQWAYCYISSHEQNDKQVQSIDDAITRIARYKKDMYNKVYNTLLEDYTKKIKAQKKKPVDEDKEVLKQQAAKQVEAYSMKFDTLTALMYMYKASILEQHITSENDTDYYTQTNLIIKYYKDAERLCSQAISYYSNDAFHQEFVIKLLINRGVCRIHGGNFRDGYDDIISARFKANKIQSKELVWISEATLWDLAHTYREVKELIDNPDRLIDGILSRVELLPPLYTMKKEFIQKLYDMYTDDLIYKKKYKEAYDIQQRRQIITMAFNALSIPHFYNKTDNTIYGKFLRTCFTIQDLEQKLTNAIVNEEDSGVIEKLTSTIASHYKNLIGYKSAASTFLLPYLGIYTQSISEHPVIHLYKFNNKLYGWLINKNNIEWALISDSLQSERLTEDFKKCIQPFNNKIYVVLNNTFITVHTCISNSVLYGMGCVPFSSRVADVERLVWLPADVVATDVKLPNIEKTTTNINDSEYIVDSDNSSIEITPQYCYANRLECSAVFKIIDKMKTDELLLVADSALYSHIASVILYSGNNVDTLVTAVMNDDAGLINSLKTKTVVLGKVPDSLKAREENVQIVARKKQKEFTDALSRGEYDTAILALQRWKRAGLTQKEYYDKKILVLVYQNAIDEALRIMQLQSSAYASSFGAYAYLLKGDVNSAEKLLSDDTRLAGTFDYAVYTAIIKGYQHNQKFPDITASQKLGVSILPANQLLLLYAQEAFVLGEEEKAKHIMKLYQIDYIPSQRELLVAYNLGYPVDSHSNTVTDRMLKALTGDSYSSNFVNTIHEYNNLSLFAILEIVRNRPLMSDEEWQQMMIVAEKGSHVWLDVQFTIAKIAEIVRDVNPSRTLQYINTVASDNGKIVSHVAALHAINAYLKTGNFIEAYDRCKSLKQLPYTLEHQWYTYYIYSAIMLGKTNEALSLLESSQIVTWDTVLYNLFKVNIQLQKIVAFKTAESNVLLTIAQNIDVLISGLHDDIVRWYYSEYKYLLDKLIDYAISFAMSRGNQRDALRYAELHKMIEGIALFDENSRYKNIYHSLVSKNFPITEFQKNIPHQVAILYISKNENDIFTWIITKTYIQPVRLQNTYKQLYAIIHEYYNDVGLLQQVYDKEAMITDIMKPVIKELSGYTTIIVIPDAYTESIPYEIIKYNNSDTAIAFMPSLMTAIDETPPVYPIACINVNNPKKALIESALKQSDFTYTYNAITNGIIIADKQISYNNAKKGLMINSDMIQSDNVFINLANTSQIAYYYCLFMVQNEMGISMLLNSAVVDVNSIIFLREFCNAVKKGSFLNSYVAAYQYIKKDKRFKNPAYWLGIRFYIRTIKGIHDGVR